MAPTIARVQRPTPAESPPVEVVYLFSRECPSHEEGRELIDAASRASGVPVTVRPVEVTTDAQAQELRFPGSPTYLVDGDDLAVPDPLVPHRMDVCRAYELPDGRIGPLPAMTQLATALSEANARRSPTQEVET